MVTLRWSLVFALFGFACVAIGAFLPWIKVGPMSEAGIEGRGLVPLILAGVGAILVLFGAGGERALAALGAVCIVALVLSAQQDIRNKVDRVNAEVGTLNAIYSVSTYGQRINRVDSDDVIGIGSKMAGFGAIVAGLSAAWLALSPDRPSRRFCPYCAETIRIEAVRCPHCQRDVTILNCSECGADIQADTVECPNCGAVFDESPAA